jgi:hypothetical protein
MVKKWRRIFIKSKVTNDIIQLEQLNAEKMEKKHQVIE